MLKFLIIVLLFGYLFFKLLGLVFKYILGGASTSSNSQRNQNYSQQNGKRPSDGNVNVDYVPKKDRRKKKDFDAGEYVDFEEIK